MTVRSISFPNMFKNNSTQTVDDLNASKQNLKLTLLSEKGEFKYDPFFGVRLKKYMFDQNNFVLRDILLDEIYEQIVYFMPQLTVSRRDIRLTSEKHTLYVTIKGINKLDFTPNTYNLVLFQEQD